MLLGIVSDTHDRIPAIEAAVDAFNSKGVEAVLHCGDFVSPFSLVPFKGLNAPLYAVFGNNDGEKAGLSRMFRENGWTLNDRPWSFELGRKKIAMLHEPAPLNMTLEEGGFDLIVFGHTHEPFVEKKSGALVVNPGELCGWVKGAETYAVVDMDELRCEIHQVEIDIQRAAAGNYK